MVSSRHDSVTDDENRANRRIRARLAERLPCLVKRGTHELFVWFSIHRFETSLVVLERLRQRGPREYLHLPRYQNIDPTSNARRGFRDC